MPRDSEEKTTPAPKAPPTFNFNDLPRWRPNFLLTPDDPPRKSAPKEATPMQEDGTYTEEDIATLKAGDLTDPEVCSQLLTAYYQNDTPRERRFRLKRDRNVFVPEARLREKLAELEGIENPGAEERADRLPILSRLAMLRKKQAEITRQSA